MWKNDLVVFDCDGPLRFFDMRTVYAAYRIIADEFEINTQRIWGSDYDSFVNWYSHNWKENLVRMDIVDENDIQQSNNIFHEMYDNQAFVFDWVENIFAQIYEKAYIAVLSNSTFASVAASLECVYQYIDGGIWGCDSVPAQKPSPDGLRVIMKSTRVESERTWMVGDTIIDVEAAHLADVRSVLVTWGAPPSDDCGFAQMDAAMIAERADDLLLII